MSNLTLLAVLLSFESCIPTWFHTQVCIVHRPSQISQFVNGVYYKVWSWRIRNLLDAELHQHARRVCFLFSSYTKTRADSVWSEDLPWNPFSPFWQQDLSPSLCWHGLSVRKIVMLSQSSASLIIIIINSFSQSLCLYIPNWSHATYLPLWICSAFLQCFSRNTHCIIRNQKQRCVAFYTRITDILTDVSFSWFLVCHPNHLGNNFLHHTPTQPVACPSMGCPQNWDDCPRSYLAPWNDHGGRKSEGRKATCMNYDPSRINISSTNIPLASVTINQVN